jgi:hypothetical protein
MASDLKDELAVPPFVEELILGKSTDRQPAEDKRPRTEAEGLVSVFTTLANKLNPLCVLKLLSRNNQIGELVPKNTANAVESAWRTRI